VLLDLHLPDVSGAEVLGQLKRDHSTAPIPGRCGERRCHTQTGGAA
jgi:response regulator RpfG family c-di-GMP phosphodiesterase